MSNQERVLNWKRGPVDTRDFKSVRRLLAPPILPAEFRLDREIPIYDQGQAGSCVGNGSCASYRYESAQILGNFDFNPSRLFVYYNARKLEGWENEDSGAYIRDGFKAMNKWGLANEKTWPYDDSLSAVVKQPTDDVYENGLKNVTVKYAAVNQVESEIKQTLISGAVVCFGFNVYSSFFGFWESSTGIMPIPKKGETLEGGHCVIIIGYSDSRQCFLIQNSWGEDWGQKGKFWMPYSFLLNGSECDDFWCIETIKIENENPAPTPIDIDWLTVSKVLFKTAKELYALKKPSIVRLGQALGLDCTEKISFAKNYALVKEKLNL